jgi:hypothetical protein
MLLISYRSKVGWKHERRLEEPKRRHFHAELVRGDEERWVREEHTCVIDER